MKSIHVAIVSLLVLVWLSASAAADTRLRRFALIVGANHGGDDRVTLRYATTDAEALSRVVRELGGFAAGDVVLLRDPDRGALEGAFAEVARRLGAARQEGVRLELLIYYSGHSDERGLLLHGDRLTYPELRGRIAAMPSDVNIAILDSCASGSFTRLKGGTKRPAFMVDESNKVRGYAFLSSSSADEAAQESDKIAASFFTHYLVSGLRGGADSNRDGKVTLNEAYQYAFSETVARTTTTQAGAQHPAYDMHLVGSGDVVMTDLRATSAALVVAADVGGRLFIRDASGRLVVELSKPAGHEVVLGLSPERYQVTLQQEQRLLSADVTLSQGQRTRLAASQFAAFAGEATVSRGAAPRDERAYNRVPFSISILPTIGMGGERSHKHLSINVLVGRGAALTGLEVGGIANYAHDDVTGLQVAGVGNVIGGDVEGLVVGGFGNSIGGDLEGLLVGGAGNRVSGSSKALLVGGAANLAHDLEGAAVAGAFNRARDVTGILVAGGGNSARDIEGAQIAGGGNIARDVNGIQVAGGANYARGRVAGVQVAVVNIGEVVNGAQIGVVNIARKVTGAQIGVVNIADDNQGVPVGLLSLARNGRRSVELWTSDTVPLNVGFKFGTRYFYTMVVAGSDRDAYFTGLGIGAHFPRHNHYFDLDVTSWGQISHNFDRPDPNLLSRLRLAVGFPINRQLSVFAGGALTTRVILERSADDPCNRCLVRFEPGFFAGAAY